jgi:hypothetical protein
MTAMIHLAVQATRGAAPVRAEVETAATPVGMVVDKVAVVTVVAAMETVAETPVATATAVAIAEAETAEAMVMVAEGGKGTCSLREATASSR